MIRVVDLSSVQGVLGDDCWQHLVELGIRGAYVKCTTGNDGADPDFAPNVAGARRHGIAPGPYCYMEPLPPSAAHPGRAPVEEAALFFKTAGGLGWQPGSVPVPFQATGGQPGDMPPCGDAEWPVPEEWAKWNCSPHQLVAWMDAFYAELARLFGRKPVIYTYPYWWTTVCAAGSLAGYMSVVAASAWALWIADYDTAPHRVPVDGERPRAIPPWTEATLWQHTGGGMKLPNGEPVDYSVFLGDEAAWAAFLGLPAT